MEALTIDSDDPVKIREFIKKLEQYLKEQEEAK